MSAGDRKPWASFCMATYRRPARLESTLKAVLGQTFSDLEVVVTDNDPERSAEAVVQRLADPRVHYHANERNLGMVGNFNRALSMATGTYVVMITDDDPVFPDMLATLHRLAIDRPGFGAYFAAAEHDFEDELVAAKYGRAPGRVRWLANRPEGDIWSYDKEQFPVEYFSGRVFPYVLWSCGVVQREIALAIGGMPDYGSPFFTDFGYIALAGSYAGCCCVNKAVGFQAVHAENFGRKQTLELVKAVEGFHAYIERHMRDRPGWSAERAAMEAMLGRWFPEHMKFLWKFHRVSADRRDVLTALRQSARVPYLRSAILRTAAQTVRHRVGAQVRKLPGFPRPASRQREWLAHSAGAVEPVIPSVIVPDIAPVASDVAICKRLLDAFHFSQAEAASARTTQPDDLWSEIRRQQQGLVGVLERRSPEELAGYLCNMSRQDATIGTVQGNHEFERISHDADYRSFLALMAKDKLVSLAEALGVIACENPEQGSFGESLHLDIDLLVDGISRHLGISFVPPPIDGGLFKIRASAGTYSERDVNALFTAYLLSRQLRGRDRPSVLEIGGGSGRVAYWSRQLGIKEYTIVDLPHINVVQGFYLLKALPNVDVKLAGEPPARDARDCISIIPDHAIASVSSRSVDLVLNQDSFPEIGRETVVAYLKWIQRVSKAYFLSINHESKPAYANNRSQINVPELVNVVGGFTLDRRELYWLRRGYVSMVYGVPDVQTRS